MRAQLSKISIKREYPKLVPIKLNSVLLGTANFNDKLRGDDNNDEIPYQLAFVQSIKPTS